MLIPIPAIGAASRAHRYLQAYAPSNILVARIRRIRPRPRVVAGLLALSATLAAGALLLAGWVASGGPGWLNLVILTAIWNAMKFAWMAARSTLLTVKVAVSRRGERHTVHSAAL
jgi:hypothetical protein